MQSIAAAGLHDDHGRDPARPKQDPASPRQGGGQRIGRPSLPHEARRASRWATWRSCSREWDRWGWHRVTFYGDLKEPVYALADTIGWKITEEA